MGNGLAGVVCAVMIAESAVRVPRWAALLANATAPIRQVIAHRQMEPAITFRDGDRACSSTSLASLLFSADKSRQNDEKRHPRPEIHGANCHSCSYCYGK
jgi:hypothetical protein